MSRSQSSRSARSYCLDGLGFLALAISVCLASPVSAGQVTVTLPDRTSALPLVMVGRQPYLDARAVAALVSGRLQLDAARGRATLRMGQKTLSFRVGTSTVRVAGQAVSLSSPPRFLGRRFLLPLASLPVVLEERYGQGQVEWSPAQRVVRVRSRDVTVTQVRVGAYPTHTRVVLETIAPAEWSVQHDDGANVLRVLLPGAVLDKSIQAHTLQAGPVRAVEPVQQPGGAEFRLIREAPDGGIRTFTLKHPDRIVIDILASPPAGSGPTTAHEDLTLPPGPSSAPGSPAPSVAAGPNPPVAATAARVNRASGEPAVSMDDRQQGTSGKAPVADRDVISTGGGSDVLTMVLDPGHGGYDTGAIGPTGLMEKDVVLDLALRLRRLLTERLGMQVIMTRTEDVFVSLQERTAIANRAKADFFLSLHMNGATKRGAEGFETYYFTREPSDSDARASAQRENLVIENNGTAEKDLESLLKITLADMAVTRDMRESSELAEFVLTSLDKLLKVENRGVKSGPFYVLATAAMPAILVESAFITNPREERKLQQQRYRQRVAEALYEGIKKYKVRYERRIGMGNSASAAVDS